MKELISIVVPVYNAGRFIEETMDCVRRQTYENWELLLVNDKSSDNSAQIIESYIEEKQEARIRLINQPENRGAARARNRGVQEAKGRYIAYLDADDLWEPKKLELEVGFLSEKQAAFAFTGYEFANELGEGTGKIVHVPETLTYKQALCNTTIFTSTVMFDTSLIDKSLLEMPVIKSEDTALWWKVLRNGYTAYGLDKNLVKYRRSENTLSSDKVEALRRIWNLYRKAEGIGIFRSAIYFCFWAFRAVKRRV